MHHIHTHSRTHVYTCTNLKMQHTATHLKIVQLGKRLIVTHCNSQQHTQTHTPRYTSFSQTTETLCCSSQILRAEPGPETPLMRILRNQLSADFSEILAILIFFGHQFCNCSVTPSPHRRYDFFGIVPDLVRTMAEICEFCGKLFGNCSSTF